MGLGTASWEAGDVSPQHTPVIPATDDIPTTHTPGMSGNTPTVMSGNTPTVMSGNAPRHPRNTTSVMSRNAPRHVPQRTPSSPQRTPSSPQHTLRHSRVGGNLDAPSREHARGLCPAGWGAQTALTCVFLWRLSRCARLLRRLSRCAGAQDGGACGDEQAAGEEEHQQQSA